MTKLRTMPVGPAFPAALDVCCGPRMFWFDRADQRALFVDKRRERHHVDTRKGRREIIIDPDQIADFKALPFPDGAFTLVVFDPPHTFAGPNGWKRGKYGTLERAWREEIRAGFAECFRVLCPLGTLIFKWPEHQVPVSAVLQLTPERPLFGQRCGATAKTHWIVFTKPTQKARTEEFLEGVVRGGEPDIVSGTFSATYGFCSYHYLKRTDICPVWRANGPDRARTEENGCDATGGERGGSPRPWRRNSRSGAGCLP